MRETEALKLLADKTECILYTGCPLVHFRDVRIVYLYEGRAIAFLIIGTKMAANMPAI